MANEKTKMPARPKQGENGTIQAPAKTTTGQPNA